MEHVILAGAAGVGLLSLGAICWEILTYVRCKEGGICQPRAVERWTSYTPSPLTDADTRHTIWECRKCRDRYETARNIVERT